MPANSRVCTAVCFTPEGCVMPNDVVKTGPGRPSCYPKCNLHSKVVYFWEGGIPTSNKPTYKSRGSKKAKPEQQEEESDDDDKPQPKRQRLGTATQSSHLNSQKALSNFQTGMMVPSRSSWREAPIKNNDFFGFPGNRPPPTEPFQRPPFEEEATFLLPDIMPNSTPSSEKESSDEMKALSALSADLTGDSQTAARGLSSPKINSPDGLNSSQNESIRDDDWLFGTPQCIDPTLTLLDPHREALRAFMNRAPDPVPAKEPERYVWAPSEPPRWPNEPWEGSAEQRANEEGPLSLHQFDLMA